MTRRGLLTGLGTFGLGGSGLGGYAIAEPWRLTIARYAPRPANWPAGRKLRIVALADLHACEPFMSLGRIRDIVAEANALAPDVVVLLGDYLPSRGMNRYADTIDEPLIAEALAPLSARYGVYAVLGNHDFWEDPVVQARRSGPTRIGRALAAAGIRVLENEAVRTGPVGAPVWIAGLGDQWAFWQRRGDRGERNGVLRRRYQGVDDLPGTLRQLTDDAPAILLIHEPDAFVDIPARVALTLAGHTHGGQVQLFGYAPVVPSIYGRRFAYGHVVEENRHLIVSGGLGCSGVPVRLGRPPEIVVVDLGSQPEPSA